MAKTTKKSDQEIEAKEISEDVPGNDTVVLAETKDGVKCVLLQDGKLIPAFGAEPIEGRVIRNADNDEIDDFMPEYNKTL